MRVQETRRAVRSKHDSVLELQDEKGRAISGIVRLIDVSAVGARFASTATLPKGMKLHGCLRLLRTGALNIVGRVVRIKAGSNVTYYGIAFESVKRVR
ncbi:MAG: PilZ domain-containing protein [Elusimicrobiota bacterium]